MPAPGTIQPVPSNIPVGNRIAERKGSGKINFTKGGINATRIWQVPWQIYPSVVDVLLGRVEPQQGTVGPSPGLPDIFSPEYPFLYCREVDVEGEDLLGVDLAGKACYRRAIITAKYMPPELNNSLHINSQMLSIPGTQYVWAGQNPQAQLGMDQVFGLRFDIPPVGGTFKLAVFPSGAEPTFTDPMPYNVSPNEMNIQIAYIVLNTGAGDATTSVKGAPNGWIVTIKSLQEWKITWDGDPNQALTYTPAGLSLIGALDQAGLQQACQQMGPTTANALAGFGLANSNVTGSSADDDKAALNAMTDEVRSHFQTLVTTVSPSYFTCLKLVSQPVGKFILQVTYEDNKVFTSSEFDTREMTPDSLWRGLEPTINGRISRTNQWQTHQSGRAVCLMATRGVRGAAVPGGTTAMTKVSSLWDDRTVPVYIGLGWRNLTKKITSVQIVGQSISAGKPTLVIERAGAKNQRLDQPVGKTVPMGEFTMQKHRVMAPDATMMLQTIGCVNMFTFMGFPPWTLLLTGIEAKQTRMANGWPTWDLTFKFSFNPHSHQALFRPATMQWEFVRGIIQMKLPTNKPKPPPLGDRSGRIPFDIRKARRAHGYTSEGTPPNIPPRVIDSAIDPLTGQYATTPPSLTGGWTGGSGGFAAAAPPQSALLAKAAKARMSARKAAAESRRAALQNNPQLMGFGENNDDENPIDEPEDPEDLATELAEAIQAANETDDPETWRVISQRIEELTLDSLGADFGTNDFAEQAAASGRDMDVEDADAGDDWFDALEDGEDDSGNDGGLAGTFHAAVGTMRMQAAKAATAAAAAAGNPAGAAPGPQLFGTGPSTPIPPGGGGAGTPSAAAANVGAVTDLTRLQDFIFDIGLIYPIVDFTWIAFLT